MTRVARTLAVFGACACGGARGDSTRLEPQSGQLALATRVERVQEQPARVVVAPKPLVPEAAHAQPTAAAPAPVAVLSRPEAPSFDTQYPFYGVAFHMLAQVYESPSEKSPVIGYLRRGATIRAKTATRAKDGSTQWYAVFGGGYVYAGRGFLMGKTPQTFEGSPTAPSLHDDLPYPYAKTLARDVPQYFRAPTDAEERSTLVELAQMKTMQVAQASDTARKNESAVLAAKAPPSPQPTAASMAPSAGPTLPSLVRMVMQPGFYVSVDAHEQDGTRELVRTVRGAYVRAETLTDVSIAPLHGVTLDHEQPWPLALVNHANAPSYRRDPMTGTLTRAEPLALMQAFKLESATLIENKHRFQLTSDGLWIPQEHIAVINQAERPPFVPPHARWIDISLESQTLVAYEGKTPVFATLVSTGKPGNETPTGIFRIQSKHVSATMDGEIGSDEAYSIEDVPWTMYFSGNFALHAAFWHKQFGHVRSHGCVNLAPADARHLFEWTTPNLPNGFHGVVTSRDNQGTFVVIHP